MPASKSGGVVRWATRNCSAIRPAGRPVCACCGTRRSIGSRTRFPDGLLSGFTDVFEAGQQALRKPTFIVGFGSILFTIVATRSIWAGALPVVGFSLPAPESAIDALGAYAGGWNPAGFGSPEVVHPSVAGTAIAQLVLFGKSGLATGLLTLFAFLSGVIGAARLMRRWGLAQIPGYLAGIVLMGGPAVAGTRRCRPVGADGGPRCAALDPGRGACENQARGGWPGSARSPSVTAFSGIVGIFAPAALLVAPLAALAWAVAGTGKRWGPVLRVMLGTVLALPVLMPWVLFADLADFLGAGTPAFWDPGLLVLVPVVIAVIGAIVGGNAKVSAVAGWGGLLAAAGWVVSRMGDFGLGREVESAALMAVALGHCRCRRCRYGLRVTPQGSHGHPLRTRDARRVCGRWHGGGDGRRRCSGSGRIAQ